MDRLATVKMLVRIKEDDTTYDAKLNYWLSATEQEMLAYTNRTELPPGLEPALIDHVVLLYRKDKADTSSDAQSAPVKSITEGNTTITYGDAPAPGYTLIGGSLISVLDRFVVRVVRVR
ncbi:phage head-tail connector protein [Aneurinibacillus migulanus]|uniref:Phage gp6-like head-tail connector protein n=1 Tax=Aneurinibacillus migulanus TaxID=47500 RepID=A0A0D1XVP9_ANEMI|nr:phage head-tail connector protein [Aneurinibacillus migulanus]KIV56213.1 hypothetical protein TS65_13420 [Aneurinibacillus migulanus]KON84278.1 hypothetical protein AF333_30565 [Aneurinibacillus migulanus]MED0893828.1 phage head-tail connector protein [Aneurinibacillus migulanus]MED1614507.1 phage head-tail connector protein [Aneurinibacillus migulanus]SDI84009.1 Phage gp6-like head-tail connector protein [Aneurinibacillus migulanus]